MTKEYFRDLQELGRKINRYTSEMINYRAIVNGRQMLARGLRNKYPNMTIDAIRSTLWRQEQEQAKTAQIAFDEMRVYAVSVGWEIEYREAAAEIRDIIDESAKELNEINV